MTHKHSTCCCDGEAQKAILEKIYDQSETKCKVQCLDINSINETIQVTNNWKDSVQEEEEKDEISLPIKYVTIRSNYLMAWVSAIILERC